jgi:exodeoxyribonuclease VII large subunit
MSGLKMLYQKKENQYQRENLLLDSLSPLKTLSRGYIISQQNNKIIKSVKEIDRDKNMVLTYSDGNIEVKSVEE